MKSITEKLRSFDEYLKEDEEKIIEQAADMLEFFFGQMQMVSPQMNGEHSYRFRSGGWPMTQCKGSNAEEAVARAIAEVKSSKLGN